MKSHLIKWVEHELNSDQATPLLCVSGAQGIGKTTAMKALDARYEGQIAFLALDDFYLGRADRKALAREIHPLFETRGPPGTHAMGLMQEVIDTLQNATDASITTIPRFDKTTDDRAPLERAHRFHGKPAAIVLEGWLIGAAPDPASPEDAPMNRIEARDDTGVWRRYQEDQLAADYAAMWDRAAAFFHIDAPSFDTVLNWRIEQEETTLGLPKGTLPPPRRAWVEEFILHYERITRRMLAGKRRAGVRVRVDASRKPIEDD